ncbi:MAG: hypothetical protein IJ727_07005 [Treponema sp.]|nr:hypothetical protein [Treponema sp.]
MIEKQAQGVNTASSAVEQMIGNISSVNNSVEKMADSFEVKTASHEMKESNQMILGEIQNLQNTTLIIKDSMKKMSAGAKSMNQPSASLSEISSQVVDSISKIGQEIDLFKA